MNAVIRTGGKEYYVKENDVIYVEKLNVEPGQKVTLDEVLMLDSEVGSPYVKGAKVVAKVEKHGKGKKIRIFTYVTKQRSTRKTQGHRQPYTKLVIEKISK